MIKCFRLLILALLLSIGLKTIAIGDTKDDHSHLNHVDSEKVVSGGEIIYKTNWGSELLVMIINHKSKTYFCVVGINAHLDIKCSSREKEEVLDPLMKFLEESIKARESD